MVLIRARGQERFDEVMGRVGRCFARAVPRCTAQEHVGGCRAPSGRICWWLAEAAGRRGRMGAAAAAYGRCDAEAVRTRFSAWSPAAGSPAELIVDETDFLKMAAAARSTGAEDRRLYFP
ncbi:MAG: hypothetical protein ACRDSF_01365 [Pseudonocardiaceae bacterium]